MKRSSTNFDQTSPNNEELYQKSYAKMGQRSSTRFKYDYEETNDRRKQQTSMDQRVGDETSQWSPRESQILGSFSDPPIHVIHFLDSHLTFLQSFQLCSVFGRCRIHGHNLRPLTYYSVYNYRTNVPLSIELVPSTTTTLPDITSLIPDSLLAQYVVFNVQQKGGDILLIRKEAKNDSLFIKTIREHRMYSHWFLEKYSFLQGDKWRQVEQDLHIRLSETNEQTAIIPREQFISTADQIINRWLTETTYDFPFVVLICGEKDLGKSTFTRYLINRALNHINSNYHLTYFDCDIGQCEFTMGGCLSYTSVHSPLFGPPCSHLQPNTTQNRLLYYGQVSPQSSPVLYLHYIDYLRRLWNVDHKNDESNRSMVLINTMGWGTGLGLELLKETICMCCPNVIIQLTDNMTSPQDRNQMPDMTLEWLLQQPVFLPYRRTIQMNGNRQQDYDGQLNYQYIKLQTLVSENKTHTNTPKLRARDHRLLATWSYFFSSKLSRIRLPWSQFVYVSLLDNKNPNVLPDSLENSIVAFCSNTNINQLRNSAVFINGIHQVLNPQDQIFECLGFGWIERCDKETQTYEIYTPVDYTTNMNILVSGAFDTPDEFQYMFKRVFVE